MYLRASDKATGVKNFQSAVGNKLIRRDLAAKAIEQKLSPRKGLEPVGFDYPKSLEKPLVVGIVGFGRQGQRLFAAVNSSFMKVQAIADARPSCRKADAMPGDAKIAHVYESYEKLLESAKADGLEAVIIALPSHLHAPAARAALDKGLHVFVETPIALTVKDAKDVARKAEDKKLCVAVGQQRRYNWIYDHALKMVGADLLDGVHYVRSQWHVAMPDKSSDIKPDPKAKKRAKPTAEAAAIGWWQDVPEEDEKLAVEGYENPAELLQWPLYEKYSGGLLAELGSQLFDAAAMFVAAMPNRDPKRPYPLSVSGAGSQTLKKAQGDIDDHVHCIFEYAIEGYLDSKDVPPKARKKIALQFDFILGSEFDGYGETVLGRQGSLVLEDEKKPMLFHTSDVDKTLRLTDRKDPKTKQPTGRPGLEVPKDGKADEDSESYGELLLRGADAGFGAELEHFAFCCRSAPGSLAARPRSDAASGIYSTVLTVAAQNAVKSGVRVDFKDAWFDVKSDETPDETKPSE